MTDDEREDYLVNEMQNTLPPFAPAIGSGDDEIWVQAKREHEAAGKILDALRPVSQAERARILHYMWDKYVLHPDPPNND